MMRILSDARQDLTLALRLVRRSPLVSAVIVLCLGFSIGAMTTVFAWTRGLVTRPLPAVGAIDRLVSLKTTTARDEAGLSYAAYRDVRDATRALHGLAAFGIRQFNLQSGGERSDRGATPVWGVLASANYFDVLGVRPVLGRGFTPEEGAAPGAAPVAVISHPTWQSRFAGDPNVLGRRIHLNGRALTIVGVAPPGFAGTITGLSFEVWVPITMHAELSDNPGLLEDRSARWLDVFGRLAPAASIERARAEARATGAHLASAHAEDREYGLAVKPLDTGAAQRLRPLLAVLLGISGLVLLIVCSNVANLLLLRGAARERELAIRAALGAGRQRLVRQLVAENVLLAGGGAALGLLLAAWGRQLFTRLLPPSPLPITIATPIDWGVVGLAAALGVLTVLTFGLAPAVRAARQAARGSLATGARGSTASHARLRGALVSAQFALSLGALVCAGLFLRRLEDLRRLDRGFREPERVLLVSTDFTLAGHRSDSARRVLVERVVDRLRALPGVRHAAAATFVPLGFTGYSTQDVGIHGYTPRPGESMSFLVNRVGAGYFETMGVAITRGRAIASADREDGLPVAVVNESFVRRFLSPSDPIGHRIRLGTRELVVVGVAADGKYRYTELDRPTPPFVYVPYAQSGSYAVVFHVRTGGDPLALVPAVRREMAAVDPDLPVLSPATLDAYTSLAFFPVRLGTAVLGGFGAAALALAAFGLYAVMAHAVAQRRREMGIRMALGASVGRLVMVVVREGGRAMAVGAVAGLALAAGVARVLANTLPRIDAADPTPFAMAVIALGAVGAASLVIPALRATRVDPVVVLRVE